MKNTAKEQALEIVKFYMPYMYPFAAGSAYLTGEMDQESQLSDAKVCAKYHVSGIINSNPNSPSKSVGDPESFFFGTDYWETVSLFIDEIKTSDL